MTTDTDKLRLENGEEVSKPKMSRIPTRAANLVGQNFGRLLVVERIANDQHHNARWRCLCECGTEHVTYTGHLKRGKVKSCGCWQREHTKHNDTARHGHARRGVKSRTYQAWRNMIDRCDNPKNKRYHRYGGRGIVVCKQWYEFEVFLADMGESPPLLTIERIDNDGNYEPDNCKWATRAEQARNTCRTRRNV